MPITIAKTSQPCSFLMPQSAPGKAEITEVKIMIDMPLPMPCSVISSPSHMIVAVPAVIVMTMMSIVETLSLTSSEPPAVLPSSCPVRASATMPVDCRIARPRVR